MQIPKTIHYCCFGRNPLPESAKKCIASWRKYLPDYEIKEWNEDNFDVNIIPYTAEAYKAKKYAFVSDYARFWILYKYGGVYFDTDVEVIKSMDEIIARGPFMGCENEAGKGATTLGVTPGLGLGVNPGLGLGVNPGLGLIKELIDIYNDLHFLNERGEKIEHKTIVSHTTEILVKHGLKDNNAIQCVEGIYIYPKEFFCPKDYYTGELHLTPSTYSIHHYSATWFPWYEKIERKIFASLGLKYRALIKRHICHK